MIAMRLKMNTQVQTGFRAACYDAFDTQAFRW